MQVTVFYLEDHQSMTSASQREKCWQSPKNAGRTGGGLASLKYPASPITKYPASPITKYPASPITLIVHPCPLSDGWGEMKKSWNQMFKRLGEQHSLNLLLPLSFKQTSCKPENVANNKSRRITINDVALITCVSPSELIPIFWRKKDLFSLFSKAPRWLWQPWGAARAKCGEPLIG